jgi:hypothetical protein
MTMVVMRKHWCWWVGLWQATHPFAKVEESSESCLVAVMVNRVLDKMRLIAAYQDLASLLALMETDHSFVGGPDGPSLVVGNEDYYHYSVHYRKVCWVAVVRWSPSLAGRYHISS